MNTDPRDTQTPTTDANMLLTMLVIFNGTVGEATASLIAGMYPSPIALTN